MRNNKINPHIKFVHEHNAPKINYMVTAILPFAIYSISTLYILKYHIMDVTKVNTVVLATLFLAITPFLIICFNIFLRYIKIKPAFIFNSHEITEIRYPPLIYDVLLSINLNEQNNIQSIAEVKDISQCNIHISYKFTISTMTNGYTTFIPTKYFAYASANQSYAYQPIKFDIEVYKNNEVVYTEDLEYFEKIYFSNPYNRTMNMNKFIQLAINDVLNIIN